MKVYRVEANLPPEAISENGYPKWNWQPKGWDEWVEENGYISNGPDGREYMPFRWPRRRHYLSRASAERAAARFRQWGATAEVVSSMPVVFQERSA